jgi:hypothetical protein
MTSFPSAPQRISAARKNGPLDQGCRERWKNSNITTVRRADRSGFVADMRPVTGEIFHPKIQPWSLFGSVNQNRAPAFILTRFLYANRHPLRSKAL